MDFSRREGKKSGQPVGAWRERVIDGEVVAPVEIPSWLSSSYAVFRERVLSPGYPCFFGARAEQNGEMFYAYASPEDVANLPVTMRTFAAYSGEREYRHYNIAVFFEPELHARAHPEYHDLFWKTLAYLEANDEATSATRPPDDPMWEFSFAGVEMFVVCACPSYTNRSSRNLGPGMVLLFQPRSVFVDKITNRVIGLSSRTEVRRRLQRWDKVPAHPDLGVYGEEDNREWRQYFLPDDNQPVLGQCPLLAHAQRVGAEKTRGAAQPGRLEQLERELASALEVLTVDDVTVCEIEEADRAGLGVALELTSTLRSMLSEDSLCAEVDALMTELTGAPPLAFAVSVAVDNGGPGASAMERRRRWALTFSVPSLAPLRDSTPAGASARSATERALLQIWRDVLGRPNLSERDRFFANGGNSLVAAEISARVAEHFHVSLPLRALFEVDTVEQLTAWIERAPSEFGTATLPILRAEQRPDQLPASSAQQRMWLLWQLDPLSSAYNISGVLALHGALDIDALARAWTDLFERHEALRTYFEFEAGVLQQCIGSPVPVRLESVNVEGLAGAQRATHEVAQAPFDLTRGPLVRIRLLQISAIERWLVVVLHHSIADGASMDLMVSELSQLYSAHIRGERPSLPALTVQYADYALWQSKALASDAYTASLDYWRGRLTPMSPRLELPSDRPRKLRRNAAGDSLHFALSAQLTVRLRALGEAERVTPFMVLLATFAVLLSRYSGQDDVSIGVPMTNRGRSELQRVFGLMVNTQVIRVQIHGQQSFSELLDILRRRVLEAYEHQELPFERVIEALAPERDHGDVLFQVMFNHQLRDLGALNELPGLTTTVVPQSITAAKFELVLNTVEDEHGSILGAFDYATDVFERTTIERMRQHFEQLLEHVIHEMTRPLGELAMVTSAEQSQLEKFARSESSPLGATLWLPSLEQRVLEAPHSVALMYGRETLTYAQLHRRANQLAQHLRSRGAGPDVIIGVALARSFEAVIAVLAVLKSGAAYLPLDLEQPAQRLGQLSADAGALLVLTDSMHESALSPHMSAPLCVVDALSRELVSAPDEAPCLELHPDNLAYVLYTSGSSGHPKAVGNTHGALASRLAWMQREYVLDARDVLLHKTPLGFDVSVWELLWPLAVGARLAIAEPDAHRDPSALARTIQEHGVTSVHFVPTVLREFLSTPESMLCTSLQRVFSGGEALSEVLRAQTLARFPQVRFDNRYGPTEATINATYWSCSSEQQGSVPIGRPLGGSCAYVLDATMNLVPCGTPGELWLGGMGLARGYVRQAGLTAERFVPNPFAVRPGERLYRTGDRARWRPDGALEYLGRGDDQVKLRGVRVELAEVEAALQELAADAATAAAVHEGPDGGPRLIGYVASAGPLDVDALRARMAERLPRPLVPTQIVQLPQLPRLTSGKLDRRALPEPRWRALRYSAPRSEIEQRIADIWRDILRVPRVGLGDEFFALGGHSLLATQILARINAALETAVPLRTLFEHSGFEAFCARVAEAVEMGLGGRHRKLPAADRTRPLPVSYSQERMWFLWSLEPNSPAYNVAGAVRMTGVLDVGALDRALQALVERHESLRTTFYTQDGVPLQRVAPSLRIPIVRVDLTQLTAAERERRLREQAERHAHGVFDLERGPLLRVLLLTLGTEQHELLITVHHIVAEGWTMDVFAREYIHLYEAFACNTPPELPALPLQYADFAVWQRGWIEGGESQRHLDYWQARLGSEHPVLELPRDRPRPMRQSLRGEYHRFRLPEELARSLRAFNLQHGLTPFITLSGALCALLYRYTGQRELRIGYPVANRACAEFEGLIGAFLNTQVLCCHVWGQHSALSLLTQVRDAALDAQAHQDLPFHRIAAALNPARSAAHTPLFQVMCNVQRWEFQQRRQLASGLVLEFLPNDSKTARFDLALNVSEIDDRFECSMTYDVELFDRRTIEQLSSHWLNLLGGLLVAPETVLDALPLLDEYETAGLLRDAVRSPTATGSATILDDIAVVVRRQPDSIALSFEGHSLTYAELDRRSNQLAHALRECGIGSEMRVGICSERSLELLVGVLAILKTGAAYLPIDPEYPRDRIAFMLTDSEVEWVLSQPGFAPKLSAAGARVYTLDAASLAALTGRPERAPVLQLHPDSLAYAIYTSGSTGRPKAVGSTHGGMAQRLRWMQGEYGLSVEDRLLQKTPLSFDVSVWELFLPLIAGARLIFARAGDHRDPARIIELVQRERLTIIHFVPSLLGQFLVHPEVRACSSLQHVFSGGEALTVALQQHAFEVLPQVKLHNRYGPTEAHIFVSYWNCRAEQRTAVPIGFAVPGAALHILDAELNLVPSGAHGELYLGGAGLARGYLSRPGLTAERFVPDPFAPLDDPGRRLYRSGDRARRREDGAIEYLGRFDEQVKVRGFRIELREIEVALRKQAGVREAIVSVREAASGKQLVAYVVPGDTASVRAEDLKEALRAVLPEYMVPAHVQLMAALPLTSNGKIDLKALPEPIWDERDYVPPHTDIERQLVAVWQDVLRIQRVGIEDNFFELGGDSIISLQLVNRARERGIRISASDVLLRQTVSALAQAATPTVVPRVAEPLDVEGVVPLTPIQHWFFAQAISNRNHWNQALLLDLMRPVQARSLARALDVMLSQHDALRLRFAWQPQHGVRQIYAAPAASESATLLWHRRADSAQERARIVQDAHESLDLERGPLLRAVLFEGGAGAQLLLVVHHLVIDGVSWRVLLRDLETATLALESERPIALPPKTDSFQRWSRALDRHARSQELRDELPYWRDLIGRAPQTAATLPVDALDAAASGCEPGRLSFALDVLDTAALLTRSGRAYRTQIHELLLTALARTLCHFQDQPSVLVDLEGHGREDLDGVELSRTVGWFTSIYPVHLAPELGSDDAALGRAIKEVKECLRTVPKHGLGFGVLRYLAERELREVMAGFVQPRVSFNYLGQLDAGADATLFALSNSTPGNARSASGPSEHWLSFEAMVRDGMLQVDVRYDRAQFRQHTVEQLAAAYRTQLHTVIAHCLSDSAAGVTPSDFPSLRLSQRELDALPVDVAQIEDIWPLPPVQRGILFHALFDPGEQPYVNQLSVEVEGLDLARFRDAWQTLFARHPVLRAGFVWRAESAEPFAIIARHVEIPIEVRDMRGSELTSESATELAAVELAQGFDLERAPLHKLLLVRQGEERYLLIWTHHHLLLDGWSFARLIGELLQLCAGISLPQSRGRYRDYLAWLATRDHAASEQFWRTQLADLSEPTLLARSLPLEVPGRGYGTCVLELTSADTEQLQRAAQREHVTLNTWVQGAWLLLLQRCTGQSTLAFGTAVVTRPPELDDIESVLGLFINTLPVVQHVPSHPMVADWLRGLQRGNIAAREHDHSALYDIQRWCGRPGQPLFDTLLAFENYPVDRALQERATEGLRFSNVRTSEATHYPLTLLVRAEPNMHLQFVFMREHFSEEHVRRLAEGMRKLLFELADERPRALGTLSPLPPDVLAPAAASGAFVSVMELMARQVTRTPDAIAVVSGSMSLSYAALGAQAQRLAAALRARGVGPEVSVGLCMERGVSVIVGVLGILHAGAVYVPLDPELPRARLAFMIADSALACVLTSSLLRERLTGCPCELLYIDGELPKAAHACDVACVAHPDGLAYSIYTSGSTGLPKAAGIAHAGLSARLAWLQETYPLAFGDRVLQKTSLSFDVSVPELLWPLIAGATLVFAPVGAHRDPHELWHQVALQRISVTDFVPTMLQAFVAAADDGVASSLRHVLSAGEALPLDLPRAFAQVCSAQLHNLYGPTEASVYATAWTCREDANARSVPIGAAIGGTAAYVLDRDMNPVLPGVSGELYIAGVGLARGYGHRPGLTAERFVPNPFAGGERLYRTGDRVRQRPDAVLEYLGRLDDQVKIRGFRIELGEITARLREHAAVSDAIVTVHEGRLVAYVVPHASAAAYELPQRLQQHLAQHMPDYMMPAHFELLEHMPLASSGKIDRRALPDPEWRSRAPYIAPEAGVELTLAEILRGVLGVERVGRDDNFFELGGDSISSLQVVARAREHAGIVLAPKDVFEHQTPRALAALARERRGRDAAPDPEHAPAAHESAHFPLSPLQRGMLFHSLLQPERELYINQVCMQVTGLDTARFERAWRAVIVRHDVLRTSFVAGDEGGAFLQRVALEVPTCLTLLDWRELQTTSDALATLAARERQQGFDLAVPPLQRMLLVKLPGDRCQLIWTHHHALLDGWSRSRIFEEVLTHYAGQPLPELGTSYRDYVVWLDSQNPQASERYWREQLLRLEEPTLLSAAFGTSQGAVGYDEHTRELDLEHTQQLQRVARAGRFTLNTLIQGAWLLLLRRVTGHPSVSFGATVAGRPPALAGIERAVGLFINTLPVIADPRPEQRVREFLQELQTQNLSLRDHEHTPLYELQRWSGQAGRALFDTIVAFENYPLEQALGKRSGLHFDLLDTSGATNYPLTVVVTARDRLRFSFGYQRSHFTAAQVAVLAEQLELQLCALARSLTTPLGALVMGSASERAALARWNDTQVALPFEPVHACVERWARLRPHSIAVVSAGAQLSYGELDRRANQLARLLRGRGVGAESFVGVCMERSLELAVSCLAILKTGAVYVPLEPEYPRARLAYMVADSGCALVLTQRALLEAAVVPVDVDACLCVDASEAELAGLDDSSVSVRVHPLSAAYCIYTSGSTGQPKGAVNTHGALFNRLAWMQRAYILTDQDRVLHKTPIGFDVSMWELLWPLIGGAQLIMAEPGAQRDPQRLRAAVVRHGVTTLHFVPSMLRAFLNAEQLASCRTLRQVICSGEALSADLQREFTSQHRAQLYNLYGPTEAAIDVTHWHCVAESDVDGTPIGQPIANVTAHVLDAWLEPVVPGAVGELYIGGVALARGYHDRAGLTASRFVPDPFAEASGQRLYRTGDLVRRRPNGTLVYVGRSDDQVKVRGNRIELGEIESRLRAYPAVRDAVVIAREHAGAKQLVAYLVAEGEVSALVPSLREHLRAQLPEYMLPSAWQLMAALPLTPNGKLDRKALPAPESPKSESYDAPDSALERQLARIWSAVLGVEDVGLDENFFELGGDSILSLQVVNRARQIGVQITPAQLFERLTLRGLAQVARRGMTRGAVQGPVQGPVPLTPIQRWFFERAVPEPARWNQSLLLRPLLRLTPELLESALQCVIAQHDALRLRYCVDGSWSQEHGPLESNQPLSWSRDAENERELAQLADEAHASLSLEHGPLLRAVLVQLADDSQRLLLVVHHLVIDGVSWRILIEDLASAYRQLHADCAARPELGPKTTSYQHWAGALAALSSEERGHSELAYWLAALKVDQPIAWPLDHPFGENLTKHAATARLCLSSQDTQRLLRQAPRAYRTQINDLLLTALSRAACRWSGQASLLVELEGHGREDLFDGVDVSRTVGWFSSIYPVRLTPELHDLGGAIKAVKEQLRAVPNRGVGYGVLRYLADHDVRRRLQGLPAPALTFNYLGQFDAHPVEGDELFVIEAADVGSGQSPEAPLPNWLSISGQVHRGELTLSCQYSADVYEHGSVQQLMNAVRDELLQLIAHCCTTSAAGMTPSDVIGARPEQAELDAVLESLAQA